MWSAVKRLIGRIHQCLLSEAQDGVGPMEAGCRFVRTPGEPQRDRLEADKSHYEIRTNGESHAIPETKLASGDRLGVPESLDEAVALYKVRGIIGQINTRGRVVLCGGATRMEGESDEDFVARAVLNVREYSVYD